MNNRLRALVDAIKRPELFYFRQYGVMDTNLYPVLKQLKKNGFDCNHVCDVGSHCGEFALSAALVWPKAEIVSFEPQKQCVDQHHFKFNRLAHKRYKIHNFAIGARTELANLNIGEVTCNSSLLKHTAIKSQGSTEVMVRTLADMWDAKKRDSLLKIDVEGFESSVLDGAGDVVNTFDYIILEYHIKQLFENQSTLLSIAVNLPFFDFIGVVHSVNGDDGMPVSQDLLFRNSHWME
jgi:FkbM family methyltransferase